MKTFFPARIVFLNALFITMSLQTLAQVLGDYQTKNKTGNWSDPNAWNIYDGTGWRVSLGSLPGATTAVFVQAGHTISIDDANAICNNLNVNGDNTSKIAFLLPQSTLHIQGNMNLFSPVHNCFDVWVEEAKIVFSGAGLQQFTNLSANAVFVDVEVDKPSGTLTSFSALNINRTLLLTAGVLKIDAGSSLTLNNASLITAAGYIEATSTSDLVITGIAAGAVLLPLAENISLRNVSISGSRTLRMDGLNNINLYGVFDIAAGATYDNGGESQILKNTGSSINIAGKFINRDKDNFTGTNGAIPGIMPVLSNGCVIEYALAGNQIVTARNDYQNVTFSGNGNKKLANTFTPTGTVYVTQSAVLDASGHTIGDGTSITNLTMDGGRFIVGTSGTQPMIDGVYNLQGGVIEFSGTSSKSIRTQTYQNIEVTGSNVRNSVGNISLKDNGSFTVKPGGVFTINDNSITGPIGSQTVIVENGGTFKCGNNEGFNGFAASFSASSSLHRNIENINVEPGSTVEYTKSDVQPITNFNHLVYGDLLISGSGDKIAPSDTLLLSGNFVRSGTGSFIHNSGTVILNGINQSFGNLNFNNLILSNGGIKMTSGNNTIIDSLKISTSVILSIEANDSVFIHSDAFKSARVAQVDGVINYKSNAAFGVERYISARRAWRFLSVPVSNPALTFHQAWQENQAVGSSNQTSPAGYGTQITDSIISTATNGFDYYSSNGPSVKTYNGSTKKWTGIAGTGSLIQTNEGLMTFVRGDRTAKGLYAAITPTVLRTFGELYTGTRPAITIAAGEFTSIGNPYASAIDMRTIERSGDIDNAIYVWDPKLATGFGYGAFQTFSYDGNNYSPTPGGGSYVANDAYNEIESGQAFFVHGTDMGLGAQLTFKETDKTYNGLSGAFRYAGTEGAQSLRNNLYALRNDSTAFLVDGVLNILKDAYNNSPDEAGALKMANFSENLAIKKDGKLLAVETKYPITGTDTIFYNLRNMRAANYRFEINAANFNKEDVTAFFEDTYLSYITPVNLKGSTLIKFTVANDSGSANPERFRMILTRRTAGPLPITFASAKAYEQNKNIQVEWNVLNQKNIKEYRIENSVDGQHFTIAGTLEAKSTSGSSITYRWLDKSVIFGRNFYRICGVGINGEMQYSTVINVNIESGKPRITINNNAITENTITIQFINQPKDRFVVQLFNSGGQLLCSNIINHDEGSSTEFMHVHNVPGGVYQLKVNGRNKNKFIWTIYK